MRTLAASRIPALLGLIVSLSACEMRSEVLAGPFSDGGPSMALSDAAHGGAAGFYFLAPMVKKPKPFTGPFDPSLSPVVRICRWVEPSCAGADIVFDTSSEDPRRVKRRGESYGALWKDTHDLVLGGVYRLRVYADASATTPLGFADLLIVDGNADEGDVPAEFIGVARGLPFQIRFRIEQGATGPGIQDDAPAVTETTPADGASDVIRNVDLNVTFSEPVHVTGDWFSIVCTQTGAHLPAATSVSGGATFFTIDPNAHFAEGEMCTVTIFAAAVSDQDANDPPDNLTADYVFEFTVGADFGPDPQDDGPAPNSVPGEPFHAFLDVPIFVLAPGLLANDLLGVPAGQLVSFGGGSIAGTTVTSFAADSTARFGDVGQLTVLANGGFAFRPVTGFIGPFTFQYRVTNVRGSGDATVTIFVGERP
jgi:hypothetical protein